MLLEKTAPAGHRLARAAGVVLLLSGGWWLVAGEHRRGLRRFSLKTR